MLARYLRRGTPTRYAIHTPESLQSVPFGLRVASLVHGLPEVHRDAQPELGMLGHHQAALSAMLHDLLHTGHPDHLEFMHDLLHGEHGLPEPTPGSQFRDPRVGDPVTHLLRILGGMRRGATAAIDNPRHMYRQYTPAFLNDPNHGYDLLLSALNHPSPIVRSLHPNHGGPGIPGVPDAYLQGLHDPRVEEHLWSVLNSLQGDAWTRSDRQGG